MALWYHILVNIGLDNVVWCLSDTQATNNHMVSVRHQAIIWIIMNYCQLDNWDQTFSFMEMHIKIFSA